MRFLFILLCLPLISIGQSVYTKDGEFLTDRETFINLCASSAEYEVYNIQGLEVDAYAYCACVCDNLIPELYVSEIEEAMNKNDLQSLFLKGKNLKILMSCIEPHMQVQDDYTFGEHQDLTENQETIFVRACVEEIFLDPESAEIFTYKEAEDYCICAIDKLTKSGYSYGQLLEIENLDSEAFNEIALPCVYEVLGESPSGLLENNYIPNDISGWKSVSSIDLVDYFGSGYKIKLTISGIAKYFLFDTGASDLIINTDLERELLLNGSLTTEDYLGTEYYQLANSEIVEARIVRLDNIQIGDYTVNNVIVGIVEEGSLLFGIGLLNKFRKWEFEESGKILKIYR